MAADHCVPEKNEFYEKNYRILLQKDPDVANQLSSAADKDVSVTYENGKVLSVSVRREDGDVEVLYQNNEFYQDLSKDFQPVTQFKGKIVFISGIGCMINIKDFIALIARNNIVVLLEAYPALIKIGLMETDFSELLNNPNIHIVTGDTFDPYTLKKNEKFQLYSSGGDAFFEQKKITSLQPAWYQKVRNQFEQFLLMVKKNTEVSYYKGEVVFRNGLDNLMVIAESKSFSEMKNKFAGYSAIIVAAGPSLSKNIHELKLVKDKAVIIAVDAAVAPLVDNGVIPHFVASVDINPYTYEKISKYINDLKGSSLIIIPETAPNVAKYSLFARTYTAFCDERGENIVQYLTGADSVDIENMQSVAHLAIGTAQHFGCNPIVFTGLDLAFSGKKDHAKGTVLNWGNNQGVPKDSVMVESVDGELIPTLPGFVAMKEICEKLVKNRPDIRHIDATEGGAKVFGTEIRSLAEVLSESCIKSVPSLTDDEACPLSSYTQVFNRLVMLKKEILEILKKLNRYGKDRQKVDAYIQKKGQAMFQLSKLPESVKDNMRNMDKVSVFLDNNTIINSLKNIMVKFYSDYLEHEIQMADAEYEKTNKLYAGYNQQVFVQKTRKKAINHLLIQVDEQIKVFKKAVRFSDPGDLQAGTFDEALFYFDIDWLGKADETLKQIQKTPEGDFYMSCVKIKQGFVSEGKRAAEILCLNNPEYQIKYDDFCFDIIEKWMNSDGPQTYKKIMADRTLLLDPDNKDALEIKKTFINSELLKKSESWLLDAKKLFDIGNAEGMADLYEQVVNTEIHNNVKAEWLQLKARFLLETGNQDEGLACLDDAVKFDSQMALLWEEIGDNLFQSNDYNSALIAYEKCLTALPDRVEVLIKIGDTYYAGGQKQVAAVAYEGVLSKYPDHRHATERLEQIRKEFI